MSTRFSSARLVHVFSTGLILVLPASPVLAAEQFDAVGSGLRVLWGLLVVLGVMFAVYYLLRKRVSSLQGQGKGMITILEVKHIPPRKTLMLVEVRGRQYLVGGGSDSIGTIVPLAGNEQFSTLLENSERLQS